MRRRPLRAAPDVGLGVEAKHSQQTRESLLETSARYQSLFAHNPHSVFSVDVEGRLVSMNDAGERLTGYARADLLGRSFVELLAPGKLEDTMAIFESTLSGASEALHTAIIRSTGERIDVAVNASPIIVDGKVVGAYGVAEDITSSLQMERDLQRTQAAVAAALDGVLIADEEHRVVYANEASVRLHGYDSADQMLGQQVENFFYSSEAQVFHSTVMALLGQSGRWTGQLTGSRRDRTTFVAEAAISLLDDGCLVAIGRDVTARVEADSVLRASEERYRAVLADIGSGYYEIDLPGTVTYLNDAAAAIYGRAREDVLGTRFDHYAAPDSVATLRQHAQSVMRSSVTDRAFDWYLNLPDGGRRLVSTSIAAVRAENGEVNGFRGLIYDVTDRHETQRALSLSEELHRLVARVTREVVWDADPRGGTATLSGAVRNLFGFDVDTVEVDADWWLSQTHPDDRSRVMKTAFAAFSSTEDQWSDEYRMRDESGRYLTVLARGLVIRDEHGVAVRFVGSWMDITQQRQQEEELHLAHQAAEHATEAKSLFLANMSHEIRTPLTSVIAGTELVLETPLTAHQSKVMGRVHRAGERLLKLVDDLLDFSRIEAGQIRVDTVPFDPATVVQHIVVWAHDACAEKELDFRVTMSPSLSQRVLGDPHRLNQVLTNIIGNAVKFTSHGHVHLTVEEKQDDAASTRLSFSVADTGPGIDPDHVVHIFQSFSQADASITRRFGGSGLGLAIAKDIVEYMGGSIGVDSRPGHGSRFFFEVPFAIPATQPEAELESQSEPADSA